MKKIRAFFNKEKDPSPPKQKQKAQQQQQQSSLGVRSTEETPPSSDPEVASALSKLPKFELNARLPDEPDSGDEVSSSSSTSSPLESSSTTSKSVPNSLDRKHSHHHNAYRQHHDYANVEKTSPTSSSSQRSSQHQRSGKPSLPIKRSKSMKAMVASPASQDSPPSSLEVQPTHQLQQQQQQMQKQQQPRRRNKPPLPAPAQDYQSLPVSVSGNSNTSPSSSSNSAKQQQQQQLLQVPAPAKPKRSGSNNNNATDYANIEQLQQQQQLEMKRSSDYANVRVVRDSINNHSQLSYDEKSREKYLEQQLAKLHEHISNSRSSPGSIPPELKKSLPLIARSSDSLDADAKRMLKDCQEYLMASFDMAEREGDRLLRHPLKNRSAESSPMTTLQKTANNAQALFSSHSSPSSSYNKYKSQQQQQPQFGKVSSPPGTIQKSVSSPTGTIQKNFCSPALGAKNMGSPKHSPTQDTVRSQMLGDDNRDYANLMVMRQQQQQNSANNTAIEAQRKVSESVYSNGGLRPRERRNSFREAVEKTDAEASTTSAGHVPKKSYESIWFSGQEEQRPNDSASSALKKSSSPREDPAYANSMIIHRSQQQHAQPQVQARRRSHHESKIFSDSGVSGYEPVQFKDSGRLQQQQQHPSSSSSSSKLRSSQLQSVGLVAEVLNSNGNGGSKINLSDSQQQQQQQLGAAVPPQHRPLLKQNSSSSIASLNSASAQQPKPPPPYKEPPHPTRSKISGSKLSPQHRNSLQQQHAIHSRGNSGSSNSGGYIPAPAQFGGAQQQQQQLPPPELPMKENSMSGMNNSSNSYANMHVITRRHSRDTGKIIYFRLPDNISRFQRLGIL